MNKALKISVLVLICLTTLPALGQGRNPDQSAIDFRQSLMVVIGRSVQPLALMVRGRMPYDLATVEKSGQRLGMLSEMVPEAFERDTSSADITTDSKPNVWTEKGKFNESASALKSQIEQLLTATSGGDEKTVMATAGKVLEACGACHDNFRVE